MNIISHTATAPPPPPTAVPLPRKRGRIQVVPALPLILPCAAGEGDHAKHGGGGVFRLSVCSC